MFFSQRRFCSRESGVRQSESSDLRLQVGAGRGGAGRRSRLGGWPAGLGVEGGMIGDWRRDSGHWGGDPEVCEIILRRLFYFETWSRCLVSSSVWIRWRPSQRLDRQCTPFSRLGFTCFGILENRDDKNTNTAWIRWLPSSRETSAAECRGEARHQKRAKPLRFASLGISKAYTHLG